VKSITRTLADGTLGLLDEVDAGGRCPTHTASAMSSQARLALTGPNRWPLSFTQASSFGGFRFWGDGGQYCLLPHQAVNGVDIQLKGFWPDALFRRRELYGRAQALGPMLREYSLARAGACLT